MEIEPATNCDLTQLIQGSDCGRSAACAWLGQAGFLIRLGECLLAIDPYLSDSLADKYRGRPWAHERMMPIPIEPSRVTNVSAVLCTHAHGDHLDPGTLPELARVNPECRFVVPCAAHRTALERGVPAEQLITIDAGQQLALAADVSLNAVPAAHEECRVDERGHHHFLGYVLRRGALAVYHSGDCVPFPGLAERLARERITVALLPVNGRDAVRRERGVPGNFTFAEAVDLCVQAAIPRLIVCHFGMFAFNTVDPAWLDRQIADVGDSIQCVRPRAGRVYWLPDPRGGADSPSVSRRTTP
jgi:L-ascorbate metabolism protein UlaG (beta-lactamase superfamily)